MTHRPAPALLIKPCSLRAAQDFVAQHHRHNKPPVGHKFSIGLFQENVLVGVATAGRPVARMLDDGMTLEITRTCTLGQRNANSMLLGALARAAAALGYARIITYTQHTETGASLRGAGWTRDADLKPKRGWGSRSGRDLSHENVARIRWIRMLQK